MKNSILKHLNKGINVLLYSARKDGDNASNFHKKLDKKKDLLYLIKTTNDIVLLFILINHYYRMEIQELIHFRWLYLLLIISLLKV